jgi:hypothetical protein
LTSDAKIKANSANARASTGPKTAQGRARAARNAHRHGLSLPLYSDPNLCKEVEALTCEIAGTDANAKVGQPARRIAEAQIDLHRVRHVRDQFLTDRLNQVCLDSRANDRAEGTVLGTLLRSNGPDIPIAELSKYLTLTPQRPQKFATALSQAIKQLLAMDRYERRALSRRKIAIREFDAARRQTTT